MVEAKPQPKIPAVRIPSDSCEIRIGQEIGADGKITVEGTPYYVHANEWVEVIPVRSIKEGAIINQLRDRIVNSEDTYPGAMDRMMVELCEKLSLRVVDWNWTDMAHNPLPKPYQNPDALMELGNHELFWLLNCLNIETADTRKNGSGGLATSS